ncbi:hypothetical protein ACW0JT_18950 [Arthrobacter sp. SA17]
MKHFAYDGRLGTGLLSIFQFFAVSVQAISCAVPAMAFQALVGWQPTHLAVWIGTVSLVPMGPAIYATLSSMRDYQAARSYPGQPISRFWSAWKFGARRLAWWWSSLMAITILLAYDFALYAPSVPLLIGSATMAAASLVVTLELCIAVQRGDHDRPAAALTRAIRAVLRRPHIALGWVGVCVFGVVAMTLPIIGPSITLFVPAVCAWVVLILDEAFGRYAEPKRTRPK